PWRCGARPTVASPRCARHSRPGGRRGQCWDSPGSWPYTRRPAGTPGRSGRGWGALAGGVGARAGVGGGWGGGGHTRAKGGGGGEGGEEGEGEAWFEQGLAVARGQGARWFELRATLSLARLWQRQGKRATARDLLAEVYGWFTEGFETADLQEAKALLEAVV